MPYKLKVKPEFSSFVTVTPELEARVNELARLRKNFMNEAFLWINTTEGVSFWNTVDTLFAFEWIEPFDWRKVTLGEIADKLKQKRGMFLISADRIGWSSEDTQSRPYDTIEASASEFVELFLKGDQ